MKIVITPERKWIDFGFKQLWQYRELLFTLATRDIKLRYQQTFLGIVWVILQPVLTSVIFSLVFGRLAKLPSDNVPYELFAFAGLLPWNLFKDSIQRAANSVVAEKNLIDKVYFPRMIIPFSYSASALFDFFVVLFANIVIFIFFGYYPTWKIIFLPLLLVINLFLASGIGLIVSALSAYYRDFIYAVPFVMQTWLYISPIAYSSTLIPKNWMFVYDLNPLVGVLEGFRWMLLDGEVFPWTAVIKSFLIGIMIFIAGTLVFRRIEDNFADVI